MDKREKEYNLFKFGLTVRMIIDANKARSLSGAAFPHRDTSIVSIRKLESASGIPNSSLVHIINGKKNPSWSTIAAILEGLAMTLSQFAEIYDNITDQAINEYQKGLEKKRNERDKKKRNA